MIFFISRYHGRVWTCNRDDSIHCVRAWQAYSMPLKKEAGEGGWWPWGDCCCITADVETPVTSSDSTGGNWRHPTSPHSSILSPSWSPVNCHSRTKNIASIPFNSVLQTLHNIHPLRFYPFCRSPPNQVICLSPHKGKGKTSRSLPWWLYRKFVGSIFHLSASWPKIWLFSGRGIYHFNLATFKRKMGTGGLLVFPFIRRGVEAVVKQ